MISGPSIFGSTVLMIEPLSHQRELGERRDPDISATLPHYLAIATGSQRQDEKWQCLALPRKIAPLWELQREGALYSWLHQSGMELPSH